MESISISHFKEAVTTYQPKKDGLPDDLLISRGPQGLSTWYAPFEYINRSAKLVICGITPGWQQANRALVVARDAFAQGCSNSEALQIAKNTASFAGAMRSNLSRMLDRIGMQEYLGVDSCSDLFGARSDLVNYTSALKYPVFKNGTNYSGSNAMVSQPYLWNQSKEYLTEEIAALPKALWLPLGSSSTRVFERLVDENLIDGNRVLFGMPHASGANAERIKYFLGEKPRELLSNKVKPEVIESGYSRLIEKMRLNMLQGSDL
ncbi:MAG: hypothetical protein ABJ308_01820 [Halieaceae bacterium]